MTEDPSPADDATPDVEHPQWRLGPAVRTIAHPAIYKMILFIYLPFLIPIAVGGAFLSRWVDGLIGWPLLPGQPWNLVLWGAFTAVGLFIVWWCYSYIVIVGGGGPAPLVHPPAVRVVIGGPYGLTRHPSVAGKLLGVIGLAFLFRSTFLLGVLLPLALFGSLIEKRFFMERRDLAEFGPRYADYQRRVPFFIPRPGDVVRLLRMYARGDHEKTVLPVTPKGSHG